jgi:hypothetical protein
VRRLRPAVQQESAVALPRLDSPWSARLARADGLVARAASRPYRSTAAILIVNLAVVAAFIGLGELIFADPAELFRELMPGTWLSCVELLTVAVIAWAIQQRATGATRIQLNNLWGLSAVVFVVFAIDEITQATIFLADLLAHAGAVAPEGFKDLDAFLLTVLILAAGLTLLRYGLELLHHPAALALLAVGVALGAVSQALDALLPATQTEFVTEEAFKLTAEAFLIGGYLLVLHRFDRSAPGAREPEAV